MKEKFYKILWDYIVITLSCLLYAFSFNCFFNTNDLAMGGFTGIAQMTVLINIVTGESTIRCLGSRSALSSHPRYRHRHRPCSPYGSPAQSSPHSSH